MLQWHSTVTTLLHTSTLSLLLLLLLRLLFRNGCCLQYFVPGLKSKLHLGPTRYKSKTSTVVLPADDAKLMMSQILNLMQSCCL
jgi:hypothetical protein